MLLKNIKVLSFFVCFISLSIQAQISFGGIPEYKKGFLDDKIDIKVLEKVSDSWKANQASIAQKNGTIDPISKNISTNYTLDNSGTWTYKKNGDKVWRLKIKATDAIGVNALFKDFHLAEGSKLFIYNHDLSQVLGSYTEKNNHPSEYFATEIIFGDEMTLEYTEPRDVVGQGRLTIEKVSSFYKDLVHVNSKDFGDSGNCQVNINCSEGDNWQQQSQGIARILVFSPGSAGWCTGSLINNTSEYKEYMLTAFHCGNNSTTANFNQWIFYFNYEFNACASSGTEPNNTNTITGAQVISRSNDLNQSTTSSDFLLLELNSNVPSSYNPYYNGWDISTTTSSTGVCIHHPSGDVKKISTYTTTPTTVGVVWNGGNGYGVVQGQTHWSLPWASTANGTGVTEGGSSGSPLFNTAGLITGTLSGGGSFCGAPNSQDQYGKLSYHWESNAANANRQLQDWLDPTNSGITSLEGSNTPGSNNNGILVDPELTRIVSPQEENCDLQITPVVELTNNGALTLTSATIVYQINGGSVISTSWSGSIASGSSEFVSLQSFTTTQQNNSIEISIVLAQDENTTNNTAQLTFNAGISNEIPFYEDFESNPTINNITVINPDQEETWLFSNFGGFDNSASGVFFDNWDYEAIGQYDWFITEAYDFSNLQDEQLQFDIAYTYYQQANGPEVAYDSLGIAASIDCGETFFWIYLEGGDNLATVDGGQSIEFFPEASDWSVYEVDLSQFNGEPSVQFAFININGFGNNLYLDNILIGKDFVSIDQVNSLENSIKAYPNPSAYFLIVEQSGEQKIQYTITNTIGQELIKDQFDEAQKTINVSSLEKGIYYIVFEDDTARKVVKFIKE